MSILVPVVHPDSSNIEQMRIHKIVVVAKRSTVPQETKVRMTNVLHALLDNIGPTTCYDSLESLHARRDRVVKTLEVDFPYVKDTLRDIFALPEVTRALVEGSASESANKKSPRAKETRMHRTRRHVRFPSSEFQVPSSGRFDGTSTSDDDDDGDGDFMSELGHLVECEAESESDRDVESESDVDADPYSDSGSDTMSEPANRDADTRTAVGSRCDKVTADVSATVLTACVLNAVFTFSAVVCIGAMWNDLRAKL